MKPPWWPGDDALKHMSRAKLIALLLEWQQWAAFLEEARP